MPALKIRVSISWLNLGMDVIGSLMTRNAFVAAASVLISESTESVTSQEVVTDSPGQVDIPS